jgi:hypothetical protein
MSPVLVTMYVRLARHEEREVLARFGAVYVRYAAAIPAFVPHLRRRHHLPLFDLATHGPSVRAPLDPGKDDLELADSVASVSVPRRTVHRGPRRLRAPGQGRRPRATGGRVSQITRSVVSLSSSISP